MGRKFTEDEKRKIDIIAQFLARHYRDESRYVPNRACACMGLTGTCLDCPQWWNLFLTEYDHDNLEDMHRLYLFAQEIH